ncbi:flagellar biosynthetic protein FliO [Clostridium aestuarii]|uniref:Flagellar protein n=1 Tax=Clostridium aestuarii TaxID=338193 RepID=A0ABT4CXH2_9CLOT|nr:flagellar biosynthetic protein FliO [Clostridium aestuarii]MCY6483693.1 flagellar biosynthetic protein FliO [Clostridium aestuarii]
MGTKETIDMFIKVAVFLPFIIFLIYLFFKFGGEKLQNIQNGKYMKVIDRMPLSKENYLFIIKIGEKGYVMSSTQGSIEILKELDDKELIKIEESKNISECVNMKEMITKLKTKKEDK